jgi:hypothetical protein
MLYFSEKKGNLEMSTYDKRLDAVEKDIATLKHDIIYKLDDTNSGVTIIKGVVGKQGHDLKYLINQVKGLDIRLEGVEVQLDGLSLEVRAIKDQQDVQGQDIKDIKSHLDSLDKKFDQVLQVLTALTNKSQ